jgi:hypothetical protein
MKVSTVKITDFVTGEENKQLVKFISRVFYKKARPRYLLADIKRMTGDNQYVYDAVIETMLVEHNYYMVDLWETKALFKRGV